jgi:hypothetical protein
MPCKGTVRLGKTGNGERDVSRRCWRSTTVVIPIFPKWRQLMTRRGRLPAQVWLLPVPHSMAGA